MDTFARTMILGFLTFSQNSEILYFIVTVTKKVTTIMTRIRHYDALFLYAFLFVYAFPSASACEADVASVCATNYFLLIQFVPLKSCMSLITAIANI